MEMELSAKMTLTYRLVLDCIILVMMRSFEMMRKDPSVGPSKGSPQALDLHVTAHSRACTTCCSRWVSMANLQHTAPSLLYCELIRFQQLAGDPRDD
jgi:hypothetical protein